MIEENLVSDREGDRTLLLGNEAIVRGAVEAGVAVVSGYPGTPASEIGDSFFRIAPRLGIRAEYGVNEKVALEVAAGAAQGGVRSLVSFKHLGLNVASDALPTLANSGVVAGMVVVTAGDPGAHTSPNEQDQRLMAAMTRLPMLDPATPEQARAMTAFAFELSEEMGVPVLLRPTTRVCHTRGVVTLGHRRRPVITGRLVRDPGRFVPLPPNARRAMIEHERRLLDADRRLSAPEWSLLEGRGPLGIVSNGVAACYVREAIDDLDAADRVTHLQLPATLPLPSVPVRDLLERCDRVLVIEELQPVVEQQLRSMALELERPPAILGKLDGLLPRLGEYTPSIVRPAVARLLGDGTLTESTQPPAHPGPLPPRPPVLCAGCPHRASFAAVRLVFDEEQTAYINDIGCYSLGFGEPLACADFLLCMGSSLTQASGMSTAIAPKQTVAFIGDSTFFHSGMTGLLNAVACGHQLVTIILDNGTTAMTGHQAHAGIAEDRGWAGPNASIVSIVRGLGVGQLWVVDPFDVDETVDALRQARDAEGVRVVVARHRCPVDVRRTGGDLPTRRFRIDLTRCQICESREAGIPCTLSPSRGLSTTRVLRRVYSEHAGEHSRAPCSASCPLGVCVPGYTALVGAGDLDAAAALIRARNPLPSICSRVCHAPCEDGCVQADSGPSGAMAINALKRVAVDLGQTPAPERPETLRRDLSVGVVGSGPAGLGCADELARRGIPVTIYEEAAEPGGMLRRAIPAYRLPRQVLDRDIDALLTQGVTLKCETKLGRDLGLEELLERHDTVFLGIGAWVGVIPELPGAELAGVTDCLTFLEDRTQPVKGRRVVILGGGDAAIDCARTALCLEAASVTIAYRRARPSMPAEPEEIEAALAEGAELVERLRPVRFLEGEGGALSAIRLRRTTAGAPGNDGRPTLVDGDEEIDLAADLVIAATGQRVDRGSTGDLALDRWGMLAAEPATGLTSHIRVYAGGDAVTGPATVIDALAAGKRAAWAIDLELSQGREVLPLPLPEPVEATAHRGASAAQRVAERAQPRHRPPSECREDFDEVLETLPLAEARVEAGRCQGCAPCAACDACLTLLGCPAILRGVDGRPVIDEAQCNGCGLCSRICPAGAIVEVSR